MTTAMVDLVAKGHDGFWSEQMKEKDMALERTKAYSKAEGRPMKPAAVMFDNFKDCDGYVIDIHTALIAMSISIVVSVMLIVCLERLKLFFY